MAEENKEIESEINATDTNKEISVENNEEKNLISKSKKTLNSLSLINDFETDKNGIIHGSIGKVSFEGKKIKANASALLEELRKLKPASAKGVYIGNIALSSTMGPGVKINPGELV